MPFRRANRARNKAAPAACKSLGAVADRPVGQGPQRRGLRAGHAQQPRSCIGQRQQPVGQFLAPEVAKLTGLVGHADQVGQRRRAPAHRIGQQQATLAGRNQQQLIGLAPAAAQQHQVVQRQVAALQRPGRQLLRDLACAHLPPDRHRPAAQRRQARQRHGIHRRPGPSIAAVQRGQAKICVQAAQSAMLAPQHHHELPQQRAVVQSGDVSASLVEPALANRQHHRRQQSAQAVALGVTLCQVVRQRRQPLQCSAQQQRPQRRRADHQLPGLGREQQVFHLAQRPPAPAARLRTVHRAGQFHPALVIGDTRLVRCRVDQALQRSAGRTKVRQPIAQAQTALERRLPPQVWHDHCRSISRHQRHSHRIGAPARSRDRLEPGRLGTQQWRHRRRRAGSASSAVEHAQPQRLCHRHRPTLLQHRLLGQLASEQRQTSRPQRDQRR